MDFLEVKIEQDLKGINKLIEVLFDRDVEGLKNMSSKFFEMNFTKYHLKYGFEIEDSLFYARQKTENKLLWNSNYYASNGYSND